MKVYDLINWNNEEHLGIEWFFIRNRKLNKKCHTKLEKCKLNLMNKSDYHIQSNSFDYGDDTT